MLPHNPSRLGGVYHSVPVSTQRFRLYVGSIFGYLNDV